MSKVKDAISDLRAKLTNRESEPEALEKPQDETYDVIFDNEVYDVIQDPTTKSRAFLMVRIQYDLKTKVAQVTEVKPFDDKAAGLTMSIDKQNRKYLFERNRRGDK